MLAWPEDAGQFSLVLGGPLYEVYLRSKLSTPSLGFLRRRVLIISLPCWAPLLLLSLITHQALGGVRVPFVSDVEVHVRFLVAVPLLIIAEWSAHRRIVLIVRQFSERNIIAPGDRDRFERIIDSSMRIRNSVGFEVLLLVFCFSAAHWIWKEQFALSVSTWYAVKSGTSLSLSPAGYWYAFVSLPIFRFLLFRWYFRIFVWYQFLWRVRGLPLQPNYYHPDRAAGLGFLGESIPALSPVLLAQTALISGAIADRVWHTGATLTAFKVEIAGTLVFLVLLVLMPLTFFAVHLERSHRAAKLEFGTLSSKYVDYFRDKWIEHQSEETESLLGTPDLQSLADLGNSFKSVTEGRLVPFGNELLIRLLGILILPLLPLVFTVIPLKEIVGWIVKLVF